MPNTRYYLGWSQTHLKAQALKSEVFGNLVYYLSLPNFMAGLPSICKESLPQLTTVVLVRVMQASHKGSIDLLFRNWITRFLF